MEHLWLALIKCADKDVGPLFKRLNITAAAFLKAPSAVRGAARVTSDNPEDT